MTHLQIRTAKILYNGTVFMAQSEAVSADTSSIERARAIFSSPVYKLIESVYELYPSDSRYVLREPIYLNYEPSEAEKAMIKVGAKRYRVESAEPENILVLPDNVQVVRIDLEASMASAGGELRPLPAGESFESREAAVEWFRRRSASTGIMVAYFSEHHQLRGLAQNTNNQIKTQHAEMNLIRQADHLRPQDGDYILVSLQSCRMCAASLTEWFGEADIKVYYLAAEPNLENVKTALFGRESLIK